MWPYVVAFAASAAASLSLSSKYFRQIRRSSSSVIVSHRSKRVLVLRRMVPSTARATQEDLKTRFVPIVACMHRPLTRIRSLLAILLSDSTLHSQHAAKTVSITDREEIKVRQELAKSFVQKKELSLLRKREKSTSTCRGWGTMSPHMPSVSFCINFTLTLILASKVPSLCPEGRSSSEAAFWRTWIPKISWRRF